MTVDHDFEARLRAGAAGLTGPAPSQAALDRILARRRAGERIPLAPHSSIPWRPIMRWTLLATAAATLLTVALPHRSPPAETLVLPGALYAAAVDRPSFPVVAPSRPLAAGRWRYIFAGAPSEAPDSAVIWEVSVAAARLDTLSTERYVYGGNERGGTGLAADTLWLRGADLRPVALHAAHLFGRPAEVEYHPDQALQSTVSMPDSASDSASTGPRRFDHLETTFGHNHLWRPLLDAVLRSAALADGWRGSMWLPMFGDNLWIDLQVAGSETIDVPAGRFDCWKVRVGLHGGIYAWVSKDRRWLVRLGAESKGEQQLLWRGEER